MKKTRLYLALVLVSTLFLFGDCAKKEEDKTLSCSELETNYSNALTAFIMNQTETTCSAFEKAAQDYLNGCAILTPQEKQDVQDAIDANDCNLYNQGK